jgi:ribose transport system substrate-binding protein
MGCQSKERTIAVIPRTCGTWLWEAEHTGAQREASLHGLSVYWNGPMREDDVQGQIELLTRVVNRRVLGIVISPIQDLPLRTPLQRAIEAGIPVVVVATDIGIPPGRKLSYVVNDEQSGGRMAARRVGHILKGAGSIAILGVDDRLESMVERAQSFESTLAAEFPDIQVTSRHFALPTVAQEQQVAEQIFDNGKRPDAIVALSGQSTQGALYALIEFKENGKIPLIGFDQTVLVPIRTGELDAIVLQNTFRMGQAAMRNLAENLGEQQTPAKVVVEPELVTKDTIDSPEVRQALDLDWWR